MWSSPRPCVREELGCAWHWQKHGHVKKKGALRVGPSQERNMHASWANAREEAFMQVGLGSWLGSAVGWTRFHGLSLGLGFGLTYGPWVRFKWA